jgi:O-antigen/teichoic acid export membrane protein
LTVLRNSAFGLAAQVAIKVLSFAFNVLVIRQLGAGEYGQYTAVGAFGAVFLFAADLGLSPYAVREFARWRSAADGVERSGQLYANMLWLRLGLAVFSSLLTLGAALLTGRPLEMVGAIALNSLGLLMYALQGTGEAALAGFERLDLVSSVRVVNQLVFVVAGGIALWVGFGYYGLIVANLLAIGLMTTMTIRAMQRLDIPRCAPRPTDWVGLLRASLPFGIIGLALGLSYRFDTVLLNIVRSDVETGYYNAAYNLVFSAAVFSNVLNTALFPSLSRQMVEDGSRLPAIAERVLRYLLLLALPIAVGACVLAGPAVVFLYDSGYGPTSQALMVVIWAVPFMYLSEFLGYVVIIQGLERRVARAVLVSSGLNVLLNLALVPVWGLTAAAIMTVVTEVVLVAQHSWTLRTMVSRFNLLETVGRPLLAAAVMGAVIWALNGVLPFLANVMVGVVVYGATAFLVGAAGGEDIDFFRKARRGE